MKYVRYDAPPELRLRYHFRDKFGADIVGARDYDPETGICHIHPEGTDEGVLIAVFKPHGYVEIDGHVNPTQEVLDGLFDNSKMVISNPEVLDRIAKKVSEDVRLEEGIKQNNPEPTAAPQQPT
jgi:hypothetical protein